MRRLVLPIVVLLTLTLVVTSTIAAQQDNRPKTLLVLPVTLPPGTTEPGGRVHYAFGRFSDSSTSVAIASGDSVVFYSLVGGRSLKAQVSWKMDQRIGDITAADLNGDGRDELAIVTADDGIVEVLRLENGAIVPMGERRYLWTPTVAILSAKSATGPLLVIALADGSFFTYHWIKGSLEPLASDPVPVTRGPKSIIASDLDGDLQDELITSNGSSQVVIFHYEKGAWTQSWQNYPWGGITSLAVGDILGKGENQLLVTTHERMGYVYEYGKRGYATVAQVADLPFGITAISSVPIVRLATKAQYKGTVPSTASSAMHPAITPARPVLIASLGGATLRAGLSGEVYWQITGEALSNWALWPDIDLGKTPHPLALATPPDGSVRLYVAYDAANWRFRALSSSGEIRALSDVVAYQGNVLISAREITGLIGGKLEWNESTKTAKLRWQEGHIEVALPGGVISRDTVAVDVPPAATINGKLYIPLAATPALFGWRFTWSTDRSLIDINY